MSSEQAFFNEQLSTYLGQIEEEYNRNSLGEPEKVPGGMYRVPLILGYEEGITRSRADVFNLNAPIAGTIKDLNTVNNPCETVVLRSVFGYAYMSRLLNDPTNIHKKLGILIKNMIVSMEKELGFGPDKFHYGKYLSFRCPNGERYKELEDGAGYEIRLVSTAFNIERRGEDYDKIKAEIDG